MRLNPDGDPIVLNLDVFSGQQYMDGSQLIASYWEEIGLQTSLEEISYDLWWPRIFSFEYSDDRLRQRQHRRPGLLRLSAFVCAGVEQQLLGPVVGTWYQTGGTDGVEPAADSPAKRAQELFDEAKVTVDSARQLEILAEIERLDLENVWEVLTVGPGPNIRIVRNDMHNFAEVNYCVLHDSDSWAEQYYISQ
ncbi:MAG: hypothetical protein R2856_23100 [Caldilineaceae bacterium]